MKTKIIAIISILLSTLVLAQDIDTLTFHSKAFNESRTVFIYKPECYKYKSPSVKLPIIYLLDGQNEWFVKPVISDIEYLRFTKEIPSAIIVVIPLKDRVKECAIVDLKTDLPLDKFLTEDLHQELKAYNPNDLKIIIGHSFSASFSLYSFYKHPNYYSAVIANSPFDKMEMLVEAFEQSKDIDKSKISISIGSINKDTAHREKYNQLKTQFPSFFNSINVFEADFSTHNSVPIVAMPTLLSKIFIAYRARYFEIAEVDIDYKLVNNPGSISNELDKIQLASKIGTVYYPPEISDINGIASRYWNNNLEAYAKEVYQLGVEFYPNYYEFYLSLYELELNKDNEMAKFNLLKAEALLKTTENNSIENNKILKEIETEINNNGW
jgi:hypothetical protein